MKRKNFKKAIEEFTSSICLKNSYELKSNSVDDFSILNNIGYAHEMCENFGDALKYYILASEKGCAFATLNIGYLYDNGLGVEKDTDKAFIYYEKEKNHFERWNESRKSNSK